MNLKLKKMVLLLILVISLFLISGCNRLDTNGTITTNEFMNPLRNNLEVRSVSNIRNCFLFINDIFISIKRVVNNKIEHILDQRLGFRPSGIAFNSHGSVVTVTGQSINVGQFYGDSSGVHWTFSTTVNITGNFLSVSLSDYDELVIFTLNTSTQKVYYTTGIVSSGNISWLQINTDLNIPTNISNPGYFAADIGSSWDDNFAFVFYNGSREYRQNGHLNWEDSSYTITLNAIRSVSCGVPVELDLAYDRQNHCVWGQWENSYLSWIASQPNADSFSWLWTRVSTSIYDYRINLRVGLNNGLAVTLSTHYIAAEPNNRTMYGTLFDATVKPAVKLSESVLCSDHPGILDLAF